MIWIKLPSGDKWHMWDASKFKVFCGVPSRVMIDTNESPPWEDKCQNCDKQLRRRGNPAKKPTRAQRYQNPRTGYRPKNKEKWT
jgi:hypothetical protein